MRARSGRVPLAADSYKLPEFNQREALVQESLFA